MNEEYHETAESYMKRILPDIGSLSMSVANFVETGDRMFMVEADHSLDKINEAFRMVGEVFDRSGE